MKAPLFSALAAIALTFAAIGACYDPKSPNLPPCPPRPHWADPCQDPTKAKADAAPMVPDPDDAGK